VGKGNAAFRNNIDTMITSYNHLVSKTINLGKDETVCYIGQPHPIIVVLKMIFALIAVFGLSILLVILFNSGLLAYHVLLWGGGMLGVTVLVWIGWQFLEWSNDLFFFTDKRMINKQRSLFSYEIKQETPILAIESVQVRKSFLGRGLDFGDLEIRTYTGSMRLPFVPDIASVQHILTYLMERRKDLWEEKEKQAFEKDIRERITQRASLRETGFENYPDQLSSQTSSDSIFQGSDDLEVPIDIVYRTHWTILFAKIFIPVLLFINSIVLLSWSAYCFADWRNDVYIITEDQLIDIDRRPFGIEEKRAAPINNVQSIRYKRNGIFGMLLNFGTVYIRIGDEEFTFDNVHRPAEVQEVLFSAKEHFHQMEEDAEKYAQRKKAVDWIDSYHQIINENHGDDLNNSSVDDK
jgi:uncharacterized membrane protein YdbT with pleckstrin-like domain